MAYNYYTQPTHTPSHDYEIWNFDDMTRQVWDNYTNLIDYVMLFGKQPDPEEYIIYIVCGEQLVSMCCKDLEPAESKLITFVGYKYDVICKVREEIHSELLAVMCAPRASSPVAS